MNAWALYDDLIDGISPSATVRDYQSNPIWTWVEASDATVGVAMTINVRSRAGIREASLIGRPLREAAMLIRSWNLVESSIGVAAINAWYNVPSRADACGERVPASGAFDIYADMIEGKRVATIGHFPFIEKRLETAGELTIIERNPRRGDYIDSAAEYLLPEQDIVFITGSTMVNKTLPRLLELARGAYVVLTGPSTPLSPVLYDYGVDGLSGMIISDPTALKDALRGAGNGAPKDAGTMVDYVRTVMPSGS
ncbi:hypothetical protein EJO69_04195 [Flaviflexus salsibiostraticola]|uniref:DUF364 domain-containing protein n=1 Tax=Flaviflexus salsibiostraticola TaxID=1282737 RepID=A0A3Q8WT01_9ACTO|nr:DUF364 domain-containing protein [Flaviflexus salsibiostraticola]AZN29598.1 hypothetical protein EJO69_04195 [Flaviflexus salsibiostraticola]